MASVQESDEILMCQFRDGDEDAFRTLFDRYTIPLIRFAYRFIGSQIDAEDVAQEVFLRVYRHKERYDSARPFRSWIFSITARLSINKVRDRKLRRETPLDGSGSNPDFCLADTLGDGNPAFEDVHETREKVGKILEILQRLPENQRTAILLCRFEHMTYEEIAQMMGTSIQAVKSLIYRGMQTLTKNFTEIAQLPERARVMESEGGNKANSQ